MLKHDNATERRFATHYGDFGGAYVPEVLRPAIDQLSDAFEEAAGDDAFWEEFHQIAKDYVGRPTPLLYAENLTEHLGGAQIYIKLEGLANTGAHKINNAIGQALLAKRLGKPRIIAETGAGQHGFATAAVCAKLGLNCRVYMGEVDVRRQQPNVFWMELFGTEVVPVTSGSRTLKDAVNEAMRDWAESFPDTHYLIGSALGPAPFPAMVREFQAVVGREVRDQLTDRGVTPTALVACVGGGSNAIGFFEPYLETTEPRLIGVEAGGRNLDFGNHASRMQGTGTLGVVQGYKSLFLVDENGQVGETHSVSAGLDYPGIGPQLASLGVSGRVEFLTSSDEAALEAMALFARKEGLVFALESAHAAAQVVELAPRMGKNEVLVVNMSGRGDKDLFIAARAMKPEAWKKFLESEAETL